MFSIAWLAISKAFAVAKAHAFWIVIVSLILYSGYQHLTIQGLEKKVEKYRGACERAEESLSDCEADKSEQKGNYEFLLKYYMQRKALEQKDGEVDPKAFEELKQK